jgi:hypothetical protein
MLEGTLDVAQKSQRDFIFVETPNDISTVPSERHLKSSDTVPMERQTNFIR